MWIGSVKLSLLRREYLSSAVYVLAKTPKILDTSKREFFQLNCLQSFNKSDICLADFNSVSAGLPCCLSRGTLKRDFLDIYLTTLIGDPNFRNISTMRPVFYLEIWKIWSRFQKCRKKLRKSFLFLTWFHINWLRYIVPIKKRILAIASECVKKQ